MLYKFRNWCNQYAKGLVLTIEPVPHKYVFILPGSKRVVYSTDDISKISEPVMVISETAITSYLYLDRHHYRHHVGIYRESDLQQKHPYLFLVKRDWNHISRGASFAKTWNENWWIETTNSIPNQFLSFHK